MKLTLTISNPQIAARAVEVVRGLTFDPLHEVIIRPLKDNRSLRQNRTFHGWMNFVSQQIAETSGKFYPAKAWKEYFKDMFLGMEVIEVHGKQISRARKTSELDVKDMAEFMTLVDRYCVTEFHIYVPLPTDQERT